MIFMAAVIILSVPIGATIALVGAIADGLTSRRHDDIF